MPKASTLINDRERSIAARVRQVRYANQLSQTRFARSLGISLDRLASFEYGRTPLTVDVADKISTEFDVSLIWLAEGRGRMNPCVGLILKELPETKASELLSKVYSPELQRKLSESNSYNKFSAAAILFDDGRFPKGTEHLRLIENFHHHFDEIMQAMSHRGKEQLLSFMVHALAKFSTDWELGERERPGRRSTAADMRPAKNVPGPIHDKDILDDKPASGIVEEMRLEVPTWKQLKKTVARLTVVRGSKAALAAELGVSRQVLGNWLSEDEQGAPNAEHTLRLLKWVRDPKRQGK